MSAKDKIYANKQGHIVDFAFDQSVAAVFPDMIRRSVPGYETVISLLAVLAETYFSPGTRVYDLGCSLGAATLSIQSRIGNKDVEYIAVDSSQSMLDKCRSHLSKQIPEQGFNCYNQDIRDVEINNASIVVLNFTLQFLPPQDRDSVIQTILSGLVSGGVLILSEKIVAASEAENQKMVEFYHGFKMANGYSDLEISQKRTALENVMVLDTLEQHNSRLLTFGFKSVVQWFQCFNFVSVLAIK